MNKEILNLLKNAIIKELDEITGSDLKNKLGISRNEFLEKSGLSRRQFDDLKDEALHINIDDLFENHVQSKNNTIDFEDRLDILEKIIISQNDALQDFKEEFREEKEDLCDQFETLQDEVASIRADQLENQY